MTTTSNWRSTDWITTDQAAAMAKVKPDTLRHYARTRHAPSPRPVGRMLMWNLQAITDWLDQRPGRGARTDINSTGRARMTTPTPRPDDRYSGDGEARENKSLEHLVDPVDPVVFDPDPSGSDMPEPSSSDSGGTGEEGSDQPADAAD